MEKKIVKLSFTGDIMCDNLDLMQKHNFKNFISDDLKKRFCQTDCVVGNLETPIVNNKAKINEKYSFGAPIMFAQELKDAGFDIFSTANNHCLDCGIKGLLENIDNLEMLNLDYVGTNKTKKESRILVRKIDKMKFSFLSYTYGTNAFLNNCYLNKENNYLVNLSRRQENNNKLYRKIKNKFFENVFIFNYFRDREYLKRIKDDIKEAKSLSDYVIFLMHSGGQYNKKVEHYTKRLAKFVKNNGVDLIIGNHPHVVLEQMNNIYYSLGNFYATPYSNHNQVDDIPNYSILLNCYFNIDTKTLEYTDYEILKTIIQKDGFPVTKVIDELENTERLENEIIRVKKNFLKRTYIKYCTRRNDGEF